MNRKEKIELVACAPHIPAWGLLSEIKLILEDNMEKAKDLANRLKGSVVVNCFGKPEEEWKNLSVIDGEGSVLIWNDKIGRWQRHDVIEYEQECPVCGRLMLVRAIPGTTWLACCSNECYDRYNEERGR